MVFEWWKGIQAILQLKETYENEHVTSLQIITFKLWNSI